MGFFYFIFISFVAFAQSLPIEYEVQKKDYQNLKVEKAQREEQKKKDLKVFLDKKERVRSEKGKALKEFLDQKYNQRGPASNWEAEDERKRARWAEQYKEYQKRFVQEQRKKEKIREKFFPAHLPD